jgi:hypothetical protein
MSVLYYVNLEQLYLKDMLAFVVYLKLADPAKFVPPQSK